MTKVILSVYINRCGVSQNSSLRLAVVCQSIVRRIYILEWKILILSYRLWERAQLNNFIKIRGQAKTADLLVCSGQSLDMRPNIRTCDVITNKDESLPALLLPALSSYTCGDLLQKEQISTNVNYHPFDSSDHSLLPKNSKIQQDHSSVPVSSVQYFDHSFNKWQKESENTKLPKLGCLTECKELYKTCLLYTSRCV